MLPNHNLSRNKRERTQGAQRFMFFTNITFNAQGECQNFASLWPKDLLALEVLTGLTKVLKYTWCTTKNICQLPYYLSKVTSPFSV